MTSSLNRPACPTPSSSPADASAAPPPPPTAAAPQPGPPAQPPPPKRMHIAIPDRPASAPLCSAFPSALGSAFAVPFSPLPTPGILLSATDRGLADLDTPRISSTPRTLSLETPRSFFSELLTPRTVAALPSIREIFPARPPPPPAQAGTHPADPCDPLSARFDAGHLPVVPSMPAPSPSFDDSVITPESHSSAPCPPVTAAVPPQPHTAATVAPPASAPAHLHARAHRHARAHAAHPDLHYDTSHALDALELRHRSSLSPPPQQNHMLHQPHAPTLHYTHRHPHPPHAHQEEQPAPAPPAPAPAPRRARAKVYQNSAASKHCHICQRSSKVIGVVVCRNIASGTCRKVTCEHCFTVQKWDYQYAVANPESWQCTHCRNVCPERAQCFIYQRINSRRQLKRKAQAQNEASASTKQAQVQAIPNNFKTI